VCEDIPVRAIHKPFPILTANMLYFVINAPRNIVCLVIQDNLVIHFVARDDEDSRMSIFYFYINIKYLYLLRNVVSTLLRY
jgi:hypothetical protein